MPDLIDAFGQPHVQLLLRLVLGGLLLLAGVTKLAELAAFRDAVTEYDVLPRAIARPFATALPLAEVSTGSLLLVGFGTAVVAWLALPLFAAFAFGIGVNLARGKHFDCHCFGAVQRDEIGWPAFLRAVALAVAALVVALGASRFGALEHALFGTNEDLPSSAEVLPVILLAAVVFDVLFLLPEALSVRTSFRRMRAPHHAAPVEVRAR